MNSRFYIIAAVILMLAGLGATWASRETAHTKALEAVTIERNEKKTQLDARLSEINELRLQVAVDEKSIREKDETLALATRTERHANTRTLPDGTTETRTDELIDLRSDSHTKEVEDLTTKYRESQESLSKAQLEAKVSTAALQVAQQQIRSLEKDHTKAAPHIAILSGYSLEGWGEPAGPSYWDRLKLGLGAPIGNLTVGADARWSKLFDGWKAVEPEIRAQLAF